MANSQIKVGEGGRKFRWPKGRSMIIFVAVIFLAGAAGAGLRWLEQYREYKSAAKPDAVRLKAEEAQDIAGLGDYGRAHREISKALDNPELSPDGRYVLLFQQGIVFENEQKYDEAIGRYKAAEAVKLTEAVAEAIGRAAEAKGDKELAISYYRKATTLVDPTNPRGEDIKVLYEQAIANLERQQ